MPFRQAAIARRGGRDIENDGGMIMEGGLKPT